MRGPRDGLIRATLMGACALAFVLLAGAEHASADTRLIAHFEDDGGGDPYGRDVLAEFYDSQTAAPEDNLFPNSPTAENLEPFPLINTFFTSGTCPTTAGFEIHQFDTGGGSPGISGLIGECRFAAFGSGWSLGVADGVEDFQINFITAGSETNNDFSYTPAAPGSANFLDDNVVTGTTQDWSSYDYLCFYICINASDVPAAQFFDDFKIQLWEYYIDVSPPPPQWTVNSNEREIWEVSLSQVLSNNGISAFTGWKHLRIPFSLFTCLEDVGNSWRYAGTVSEAALDDNLLPGYRTLDTNHIRAIIFRKGRIEDPPGTPTEPPDRVTVAIDEITVTGQTGPDPPRVARINVPGATRRCDDNEDMGLCWAQLFVDSPDVDDETAQGLPYTDPVDPSTLTDNCIDVTVWVRDWQDLNATFSAEVDEDAEVAEDDFSSEIVFVPQFQAPGTWVERWGGDFSRRKGTLVLPGSSAGDPFHLFYTDWRYDYVNGVAAENYLAHYNPAEATAEVRLDAVDGGLVANYFREYGYAYGTLFVLPRDGDGNIGRAEVIDVLFRTAPVRTLQQDRLTTGLP